MSKHEILGLRPIQFQDGVCCVAVPYSLI